MPITVQEIVNLPIFNTAKVITGIEILDKRQVEWMSAIEGPVENFVRKREFVLTTGMGCENNPELLFQFVKDVYESGASALAIAIDRYVFEVPEDVIDFAKKKNFVLIELPWELRFADLQRETMKEINKRQEKYSEKAREIQQILIEFVIQGKDLTGIIRFVEWELNCTIVFADSKGRIKPLGEEPEEIIHLWKLLEGNKEVDLDESAFRHIQKVAYKDGYLLKKEITTSTRSRTEGYFIVQLPDKGLLTNSMLQVMESLSAATALWISREDAIVKTEIRLRNDFIWGLAKNPQMKLDENVQSRAKLFGYNLKVPYLCVVGYSDNFDSLMEGQYQNRDYGFKNIIYYIEEEVLYAASVVNKHVAFTFDDDRLIIFLESKHEDQSTANHFLDLVDKRLNALVPGVVFSWGIAMHHDGVLQFHKSYKKASSALDLGRKQKGLGKRVSFEDTQLNRLLLNLADNEEVRDITLTTIAPLIE